MSASLLFVSSIGICHSMIDTVGINLMDGSQGNANDSNELLEFLIRKHTHIIHKWLCLYLFSNEELIVL